MSDNNRGSVLLEVIVSIAIITIALLPFINYFSNTLFIVHRSETESQAYKLAKTTMEIFKMKSVNDWSNLAIEANNFTISDISTNNDLFTDDYNINVYITDFDFDGDGDTDSDDTDIGQVITVEVSWDSNNRSIQLDTLVRKR